MSESCVDTVPAHYNNLTVWHIFRYGPETRVSVLRIRNCRAYRKILLIVHNYVFTLFAFFYVRIPPYTDVPVTFFYVRIHSSLQNLILHMFQNAIVYSPPREAGDILIDCTLVLKTVFFMSGMTDSLEDYPDSEGDQESHTKIDANALLAT